MRNSSVILIVLALLASAGPSAWARDVGEVKRIQGDARAKTGTVSRPLAVGSKVADGDTLLTGPESRLEISFDDGTGLTLGERAAILVDEFVYRDGSGRAVLRVTQGAFRVVTGAIGHLPGRPFSVRTPHGVIGIRGTDFWGGALGDAFNLLLLDGAVYIDTPRGRMDLSSPGTGIGIRISGQAPSPPDSWPRQRIDEAVATISFR